MPTHRSRATSRNDLPKLWSHRRLHSGQLTRTDAAIATTVGLAIRRSLDLAAFKCLFGRRQGVDVIVAENDLIRFADACKGCRPNAVLIDVSFPDGSAFKTAEILMGGRFVKRTAFLDGQFAVFRAQKSLALESACYFTRDCNDEQISNWLRSDIRSDDHCASCLTGTVAASKSRRIRIKWRLRINSLNDYDSTGVSGLSEREQTVMACIAKGMTTAEIAAALGVSPSTIDNHKARLMKKLDAHRASQLVRLALDAGLID